MCIRDRCNSSKLHSCNWQTSRRRCVLYSTTRVHVIARFFANLDSIIILEYVSEDLSSFKDTEQMPKCFTLCGMLVKSSVSRGRTANEQTCRRRCGGWVNRFGKCCDSPCDDSSEFCVTRPLRLQCDEIIAWWVNSVASSLYPVTVFVTSSLWRVHFLVKKWTRHMWRVHRVTSSL